MNTAFSKLSILIVVALILSLGGGVYALIKTLKEIRDEVSTVRSELASTTNALSLFSSSTTNRIYEAEKKHTELSDLFYEEQTKYSELSDSVRKFDRQVDKLSGNVETLEKLTTTDPELLQKYSRVYFLNEHYKPGDLSIIPEEYDLIDGKQVSIHSDVLPYLKDLLKGAKDDGVNIMVLSGYRSFEDQAILKENYLVRYGLGANQFSADQGYSEHQLGTSVDFTTQVIGQNLSLFDGSDAFQWLINNAHKYGFVLSYPKNNEYYVYEPWHWRFVGEDLARDLKKDGKYFYDLEQREIDSYIPTLFD